MSEVNFMNVTELGGEQVSNAQLSRFYQRYAWASAYCKGKDVLEVACGTGPGLGYLASLSKSLIAGDFSSEVLSVTKSHYGDRVKLIQFDAQSMPFPDSSFDVIILFEALYYIPDANRFFDECVRTLRPGGKLLMATANCSLFDFNPSPFSTKYFTVPELTTVLKSKGFSVEVFAGSPTSQEGLMGKGLRIVKKIAVSFNLIPGSMSGKRFLKRLVFGKLVTMPKELKASEISYVPPISIDKNVPDTLHQVIYFSATLVGKQ